MQIHRLATIVIGSQVSSSYDFGLEYDAATISKSPSALSLSVWGIVITDQTTAMQQIVTNVRSENCLSDFWNDGAPRIVRLRFSLLHSHRDVHILVARHPV